MDFARPHIVHVGALSEGLDAPPHDIEAYRQKIEPWLAAIFQSEHLSLLLGNGFSTGVAFEAQVSAASMSAATFGQPEDAAVNKHAGAAAKAGGRGSANIEDQLTSAIGLLQGLEILGDPRASAWKLAIDAKFKGLIEEVLRAEREIKANLGNARVPNDPDPKEYLTSFLMSFASRAASRERLHVFTTNYDRLIEAGCDAAGLRVVDRFAGALEPQFRSSRMQVDLHYTSPGSRAEPRHLEGVVHLTKLHGSLDWRFADGGLHKTPLAFGAESAALPADPRASVVVYPNSAKDVETAAWPYADLFRDFSSALCRPNSVLVAYGYGFGDSHVNRVIADMLTLPSTHLVIIAWGDAPHERVASFLQKAGHKQQVTLLLGKHFADLKNLVQHYLPKPAIDPLTLRMAELVERRGWRKDPAPAPAATTFAAGTP